MSEKKKNKMPVIGGIIALLLIGAVALYLNMGSVAKTAIEKVASKALDVKVTIDTLDISLAELTVELTGLHVGNPAGFSAPHALTVENISVTANSLSREKLVFDKIIVTGTTLNLEVGAQGTNLTALRDNAMSSKKQADKPAKDPATSATKVIINNLHIDDATMKPLITLLDQEMAAIALPNIHMQNLGQKEGGIAPAQAVSDITDQFVKIAMKSAGSGGLLQGMSQEALAEIGAQLDLGRSFTKQTGEGFGDSLTNGIKNLFGN